MTATSPPSTHAGFTALIPVIVAATTFSFADVATKVVFNAGADALTQTVFRGVIGLPLFLIVLLAGAKPVGLSPAHRNLSLVIGVLFAGNVFFLFKAIEVMPVPVAILAYFTYPLLTGIAAAATGIERLGWAGAICALAAFAGLALILGAHPGGVAMMGVLSAVASASTRVAILLVTRAKLQGADARLITVWSMASATAVFVAAALITRNWQPPATAPGWFALMGASLSMVIAVYCIFVSTARVGPFRTALFMNLEPLLATAGSAVILGELITPVQAVGGAVMIAALVAFQMRR